MSELKWYVIRCNSSWEKRVKKQFESDIISYNLTDRVSKVVIPSHKEYYVKNGKKIARETNLFPGYLLVEIDFCGEFTGIVKNIQGALHFLGDKNGKPEPLRQEEVIRILGKIDDMNINPDKMSIPFSIGENVVITDGPFENFNAQVSNIDNDRKKITVDVKIFGRKTPMILESNQIKRI